MIPNVHFILEQMEIVLKGAVMKFQEEFFLQIMGIVMGTNLAPILANIYIYIYIYIYGYDRRGIK